MRHQLSTGLHMLFLLAGHWGSPRLVSKYPFSNTFLQGFCYLDWNGSPRGNIGALLYLQGPQVPRCVAVQRHIIPLVPLGPQLRLPRQEGRHHRDRRHFLAGRTFPEQWYWRQIWMQLCPRSYSRSCPPSLTTSRVSTYSRYSFGTHVNLSSFLGSRLLTTFVTFDYDC